MKNMTSRALVLWIACMAGTPAVAAGAPVPAEPPASAAFPWSVYLGPSFSWLSLGGDFDGQHVLIQQDTGNIFAVPKFNSGAGFGVVAGFRRPIPLNNLDLALELNYQQGSMTNTLGDSANDQKATLHEVGLTLKSYFRAKNSLQPFLASGVDFPWLTVPNGELLVPSIQTQDETFRGIGYHIGGGLCYFPWPYLSLEGTLAYHYRHFTSLNGMGLGDSSKSSGSFEPTISIRYHFGRGTQPTQEDTHTNEI